MEQYTKNLADYIDLVKRRKYYIVITWLLISILAVVVALNLPKSYRSTATLLIEAPIQTNIESITTNYGDDQIQSIYQKVITTESVFSIIESDGLYQDIKNDSTKYELVELFKKNVEVKLTASSFTPQSHSGMAEIAFDISFSDGEAAIAQKIAFKLANLFIEQNDKSRTQRAIKATDFLMEESDKLNNQLQEIDSKIAKYKEQHNFSLPEQMLGNQAMLDRAENELRDTDSQIRTTKERIAFLSAELARSQDELPGKLDDKVPQSKDEALRILRAKYLSYTSIYSPSHPSLVRLKREIKALEPEFEGQPVAADIQKRLIEAKSELKLLEETYAGKHPDIAMKRKQIESLEQQLKDTPKLSQQEQEVSAMSATNPAYRGVELQYKSSQSELQSLIQKQGYLKEKIENLNNILLQAPQVEMVYTDMLRERDNIIKKYTQLKEKWLDAKLAQTLEEQQQRQSLTIIEHPIIPKNPEKAVRRKVAIGGFFAGIIAGLGVAFLVEFLEPGIRGYRAIREVTGLMPIVVIPYIESPSEEMNKQVKLRQVKIFIAWAIIAVCIVSGIVAMFLFFWPFVRT